MYNLHFPIAELYVRLRVLLGDVFKRIVWIEPLAVMATLVSRGINRAPIDNLVLI